ncbi:MAG TPA: Asp23/Gls24 family envelope stress response protein [Gaiella sp.]|uniref:Asp23/Gls24 family envelope stress response protein n=1 Tax=Gaiella sp. TaxID=2663207 RepID=UPI002D7F56AC|nr:Asp23/Gls24 family envelope stress response protein [Gaiella sp.]HET9287664.1 Asp23/Gls24 family envelope stress response protein [Gaiella sp.]
MKKGTVVLRETDLGRVTMTTGAIAAVAGRAVEESFGVVDQAGRRGPLRLLTRGKHDRGVRVRQADDGLALELHVVVDYGVNLAEVTSMVRSRVAYEVERHTGLPVKAVDVHVDSARRAKS